MWSGIEYDNNSVWVKGIILALVVFVVGSFIHEMGHILTLLLIGGTIDQFWINGVTLSISYTVPSSTNPLAYAAIGFLGGFSQMMFFAFCYKKSKFVLPLIPITFIYAICESIMVYGDWLTPAHLGLYLPPEIAFTYLIMGNLMVIGYNLVLFYVSYDVYLYYVKTGKE